jgi:DNA-binding NtrC family response regulator
MSWPGTRHAADAIDLSLNHTRTMTCPPFPQIAPTTAEARRSSSAGPISESVDGVIRLLAVDDDVRVRAAISQTISLEADLVMAAAAADAAAALALAERTNPTVALVDVLLPDEVTGLALISVLSRRPGCAVVAMSVRNGLRCAALEAGAVAFVEKGSDIDAILDAVRAAAQPHQPQETRPK